jgi:hypothetical protein
VSTFLRLELAGRDGDVTLVNVGHIVRIAPTWPKGSTVVLSDDTSLHARASVDELQQRLRCTGGKTSVYTVESFATDVQP